MTGLGYVTGLGHVTGGIGELNVCLHHAEKVDKREERWDGRRREETI